MAVAWYSNGLRVLMREFSARFPPARRSQFELAAVM
jgi:hypothetical protein